MTIVELGLMHSAELLELIPADAFAEQIEDSCVMWSRQFGYHRLFSGLLGAAALHAGGSPRLLFAVEGAVVAVTAVLAWRTALARG